MKRLYTALVAIFWLTMMGLLFQKEVLPAFIITSPAGYKIEVTKDLPVRESWMGIYFKDKKIGFSNTVIRQDVKDGLAGYRINETALLSFRVLGKGSLIRIRGSSFFTEGYNLKDFYYKINSGNYKVDVSGEVKGNNLEVEVGTKGQKITKSFKVKQNTLVSNSISPLLLFKKLDVNKELNFEIFDPVTFGTNKVTIRNVGTKPRIFETDMAGIKTRTWMSEDGDILKEQSGLGFTMIKETQKEASDISGFLSLDTQDLAVEFSLPSNVEIETPRKVSYLKIDKNNKIIEIYRDREPLEEDILSIPIEKIPEEDFIQSEDERIIELSKHIIGDEKNSWAASKKILHWVCENIKKTPSFSIPSSLEVLRAMEGDCNEHTVLFTALSRSLGIPTKMVVGLVYLEDGFYYHAWPRVYVGEWIDMDPTLGQEIADATHIPLLEGGLKEQLELIRLMASLKIEVLEYK